MTVSSVRPPGPDPVAEAAARGLKSIDQPYRLFASWRRNNAADNALGEVESLIAQSSQDDRKLGSVMLRDAVGFLGNFSPTHDYPLDKVGIYRTFFQSLATASASGVSYLASLALSLTEAIKKEIPPSSHPKTAEFQEQEIHRILSESKNPSSGHEKAWLDLLSEAYPTLSHPRSRRSRSENYPPPPAQSAHSSLEECLLAFLEALPSLKSQEAARQAKEISGWLGYDYLGTLPLGFQKGVLRILKTMAQEEKNQDLVRFLSFHEEVGGTGSTGVSGADQAKIYLWGIDLVSRSAGHPPFSYASKNLLRESLPLLSTLAASQAPWTVGLKILEEINALSLKEKPDLPLSPKVTQVYRELLAWIGDAEGIDRSAIEATVRNTPRTLSSLALLGWLTACDPLKSHLSSSARAVLKDNKVANGVLSTILQEMQEVAKETGNQILLGMSGLFHKIQPALDQGSKMDAFKALFSTYARLAGGADGNASSAQGGDSWDLKGMAHLGAEMVTTIGLDDAGEKVARLVLDQLINYAVMSNDKGTPESQSLPLFLGSLTRLSHRLSAGSPADSSSQEPPPSSRRDRVWLERVGARKGPDPSASNPAAYLLSTGFSAISKAASARHALALWGKELFKTDDPALTSLAEPFIQESLSLQKGSGDPETQVIVESLQEISHHRSSSASLTRTLLLSALPSLERIAEKPSSEVERLKELERGFSVLSGSSNPGLTPSEECVVGQLTCQQAEQYAQDHQFKEPLQILRLAQRFAGTIQKEHQMAGRLYTLALFSSIQAMEELTAPHAGGSPPPTLEAFFQQVSQEIQDPFLLVKLRESALEEIPAEKLPPFLLKADAGSTYSLRKFGDRLKQEKAAAGTDFRKLRIYECLEEILGRESISLRGRKDALEVGVSHLQTFLEEGFPAMMATLKEKLWGSLPSYDRVQIMDAWLHSYEALLKDQGKMDQACLLHFLQDIATSPSFSNQEVLELDDHKELPLDASLKMPDAIALVITLMQRFQAPQAKAEAGFLGFSFLASLSQHLGEGGLAPLLEGFAEEARKIPRSEEQAQFIRGRLEMILDDYRSDGGKHFKQSLNAGAGKTVSEKDGTIQVGDTILPVNSRN